MYSYSAWTRKTYVLNVLRSVSQLREIGCTPRLNQLVSKRLRRYQSMKINIINYNQKNLLIDIDWLSQSIKIDNHSRIRLKVIDFHWLLLVINSWLCNGKNPVRHLLKHGRKHNNAARSVEISISCVVRGYHHCPFEVKEGEVFSVSKKRGERGNAAIQSSQWKRPAWPSPSGVCQHTLASSSRYFRVSTYSAKNTINVLNKGHG